jgi:uncharacterized protein
MRWRTGRQSNNVEDRRGLPVSRGVAIGGGGGCGLLALILLALAFGVDPTQLLQNVPSGSVESPVRAPGPAQAEDEQSAFVSAVLADTEDTWHALLDAAGVSYVEPKLVLYSDYVESACGLGQAAMGPFYCPGDQKVYLDLAFFADMRARFHAPGDFAQAYVIAHEVGHHVQNLLGTMDEVERLRGQLSRRDNNTVSVRLELQADCFAGIWAHHAQRVRRILEPGDIEEALGAASAVGDDRIQRQTQGRVVPDSFTHGSSAQRVHWFRRGFATGELAQCNTFRITTP